MGALPCKHCTRTSPKASAQRRARQQPAQRSRRRGPRATQLALRLLGALHELLDVGAHDAVHLLTLVGSEVDLDAARDVARDDDEGVLRVAPGHDVVVGVLGEVVFRVRVHHEDALRVDGEHHLRRELAVRLRLCEEVGRAVDLPGLDVVQVRQARLALAVACELLVKLGDVRLQRVFPLLLDVLLRDVLGDLARERVRPERARVVPVLLLHLQRGERDGVVVRAGVARVDDVVRRLDVHEVHAGDVIVGHIQEEPHLVDEPELLDVRRLPLARALVRLQPRPVRDEVQDALLGLEHALLLLRGHLVDGEGRAVLDAQHLRAAPLELLGRRPAVHRQRQVPVVKERHAHVERQQPPAGLDLHRRWDLAARPEPADLLNAVQNVGRVVVHLRRRVADAVLARAVVHDKWLELLARREGTRENAEQLPPLHVGLRGRVARRLLDQLAVHLVAQVLGRKQHVVEQLHRVLHGALGRVAIAHVAGDVAEGLARLRREVLVQLLQRRADERRLVREQLLHGGLGSHEALAVEVVVVLRVVLHLQVRHGLAELLRRLIIRIQHHALHDGRGVARGGDVRLRPHQRCGPRTLRPHGVGRRRGRRRRRSWLRRRGRGRRRFLGLGGIIIPSSCGCRRRHGGGGRRRWLGIGWLAVGAIKTGRLLPRGLHGHLVVVVRAPARRVLS
mmetsp:Transcript_24551/g.76973  ORF Transcript_24551/g.76973 Transcript_24551/m.76973 type:complete len:677 (+) Transcript_24551:454-2484(+)